MAWAVRGGAVGRDTPGGMRDVRHVTVFAVLHGCCGWGADGPPAPVVAPLPRTETEREDFASAAAGWREAAAITGDNPLYHPVLSVPAATIRGMAGDQETATPRKPGRRGRRGSRACVVVPRGQGQLIVLGFRIRLGLRESVTS